MTSRAGLFSPQLLGLLLAALIAAFAVLGVCSYPVWWDEGWNLVVAKNLATEGYFGEEVNGRRQTAALAASPAAVLPVALSFKIFGVGLWQGRLAGMFFTFASLLLLVHVTRELYDQKTAIAAIVLAIGLGGHQHLQAVLVGSQVIAEMPAICFLLAGYACLIATQRLTLLRLPLVCFFWGLACLAKAQIKPFWLLATIIPILLSLFRRRWKESAIWSAAVVGAFIFTEGFNLLWTELPWVAYVQTITREELYPVTGIVLDANARREALKIIFRYGMPLLLSLGILVFPLWSFLRSSENTSTSTLKTVELSLYLLTLGWFVWFATLSAGWPRYAFPAFFLGNIFIAKAVGLTTEGFSFRETAKKMRKIFVAGAFSRERTLLLLGAISLLLTIAPVSIKLPRLALRTYYADSNSAFFQTIEFLNRATPEDSLIETYDTELFFLLNRRYHHPPDKVHIALNKRLFQKKKIKIAYDALAVDPDYLVVGPFGKMWGLYLRALQSGQFTLEESFGPYQIFKRK